MFTRQGIWKDLTALAGLLAAGCATTAVPPTELPEVRPGYVAGYLEPAELPDSKGFLPPPPAAGTAAFAADEELYRATRKLRDTPRWTLATSDAELRFPQAAGVFSCVLGVAVSAQDTPHLNMLLRRVRMDASRANDRTKDLYKRPRPYVAYKEASCTPAEKHKDDSYPSGHASIGWAWALTLAEIVPERADAIFARGLAFGMSRAVCGVHWKSDIEAGRVVGAATVSRLHANPVYREQLALAKAEIAAARAARPEAAAACAAQAQALAAGP